MLDDIRAARMRLTGVVLRTPLLPIREDAFIKPESLQPTGSFKIRGAYSALSLLGDAERTRGVVAHSSGNHGQAVARAARLLGIRAVVVMPNNAPDVKVAGVRAEQGEIIFVGPHNEERVARAHEIADRDGMHLVPSANHPAVIAGQGTVGLEIHEQLAEMGISDGEPVVVVVPVGLGGLAAGICACLAELRPTARVFGAEPTLAADTRDSLAAGVRTAWPAEQTARTIADGLRGEMPAELPFELLRAHLAGVVTVEESEIVAAMKVAAREAHLVLEPSGAVPLAALLFHRDELSSKAPVVVVASGGNVDAERYVEWLSSPD